MYPFPLTISLWKKENHCNNYSQWWKIRVFFSLCFSIAVRLNRFLKFSQCFAVSYNYDYFCSSTKLGQWKPLEECSWGKKKRNQQTERIFLGLLVLSSVVFDGFLALAKHAPNSPCSFPTSKTPNQPFVQGIMGCICFRLFCWIKPGCMFLRLMSSF